MTPSTLPSKLYRPLAEVKSYVDKMPDGVKLAQLSSKVGTFGALNKRDKDKLIEFLKERESILVIQARAKFGKNLTTFLRHKKYGYPQEIPGYIYPPVTREQPKAVATIQPPTQEPAMEAVTLPNSPEALRKQAEQLLKAAEEAERARSDKDFMNKKLAPVKLEICQAAGQIQRKMDELIDATDILNKAVQKLKDLTA
ncbi:hypothetical protein [Pantoea sp.]|uniref:hypothetical protein n=1 Tax=Pantoea sp. TaxID=69393 RepID=UPI0028B26771|nr:hypothetical protein [Pantoea sp.]